MPTHTTFQKNLIKTWCMSLTVKAEKFEQLNLLGTIVKDKCFNARQILGIDLYEAQIVRKYLEIHNLNDLFHLYEEDSERVIKILKRKIKVKNMKWSGTLCLN